MATQRAIRMAGKKPGKLLLRLRIKPQPEIAVGGSKLGFFAFYRAELRKLQGRITRHSGGIILLQKQFLCEKKFIARVNTRWHQKQQYHNGGFRCNSTSSKFPLILPSPRR